jgi:uncharacterized protein (TIGR03083 family)
VDIDERAAYAEAARWFRTVVDGVDGRWDEPGLGEWNVRDLVGHASRSLVTVETYLDAEPGEVTLPTPASYLGGIRGAASGPAVAERGRAAGRAMGEDPVAFLADLDARVQAKVAAAPGDAFVGTPFGGMRLVDYLPTRTFELVVHGSDLAAALGRPADPPVAALRSALRLVGDVLADGGQGPEVLLALTGRRALPAGFSLV